MTIRSRNKYLFDSVIVELTNFCNFKCPFCPSEYINRKKGFMDIDIMKKILNEISDKKLAEYVQFGLMGEPFLHKDLFKMLNLCRKYSQKIRVFTNGSLFTDEVIERILESHINELYISYRAVDETGFSFNSSYNFKKYENQIKQLFKKAHFKNIGSIYLKVFMKSIYSKLVGTKEITNKLKGDQIEKFVMHLFDFIPEKNFIDKKRFLVNHNINIIDKIFIRFETISTWNTVELSQNENFKKGLIGACDGLSGHFGILWNGDVTTCCKDYNGVNILGNVDEASLLDILNKGNTKKIAKALSFCYLPTDYCRICRGGNSYLQSFMNQVGSIVAYKIPFIKKTFLKG